MEGLADAFKRVNPDNIAEVEVTVGSDGARHYLRSIFIFAAAVKMANAGDGRLLRACLFADATFTKLLTWLADQHATESVSPSLSACLLPPQCRVAALSVPRCRPRAVPGSCGTCVVHRTHCVFLPQVDSEMKAKFVVKSGRVLAIVATDGEK